MGVGSRLVAALIGEEFELPEELTRRYPELAHATYRRGDFRSASEDGRWEPVPRPQSHFGKQYSFTRNSNIVKISPPIMVPITFTNRSCIMDIFLIIKIFNQL